MTTWLPIKISHAQAKNTIADLCDSREVLKFGDADNFARKWILRTLFVELEKINFEDDQTDRTSKAYNEARALLEKLTTNRDWLHADLVKFLESYHNTARAPEIETIRVPKPIPANGHAAATIVFRVPVEENKFLQVSDLLADLVPVMEDTLADPLLCKDLEKAFIERLQSLIKECGITHLCFIEKEVGPIGALLMFSAVVSATGLPACVFREANWPPRAAIAGRPPKPTDRVAFVYDLIVSGVGIASAAKSLFDLTGADTCAAMVLFRYGVGQEIQGKDGKSIRVESLASGKYEGEAFSDAGHIQNVGSEGAASLQKTSTDTVGSVANSATTRGHAMEDLRENKQLKKPDVVRERSRSDQIDAIKKGLREERRRVHAVAETAQEKKKLGPPVNLALVERFALEPETLSSSELKTVKKILESHPNLQAQVKRVSKSRGRFRESPPNKS
ncbi:MAG: hypothetical protein WB760_06230 [Xanthobacteraceae bacterium]